MIGLFIPLCPINQAQSVLAVVVAASQILHVARTLFYAQMTSLFQHTSTVRVLDTLKCDLLLLAT